MNHFNNTIKKIFWGILFFSFLIGCNEKSYDYQYAVKISNSTNDTITMEILPKKGSSIFGKDSFDILPLKTVWYHGSRRISKGQDPRKFVFRYEWDSVFIYQEDTIRTIWVSPPREEEEAKHHIFNYNSWEDWLFDDKYGVCLFTIQEEDLSLKIPLPPKKEKKKKSEKK